MPLVTNAHRENRLDYMCNQAPKCPHCDSEIDVSGNELYQLYEDGEHEITCPKCDKQFLVVSQQYWMFSTDLQPAILA